jgi:DNA-binding NtrC family response regulator
MEYFRDIYAAGNPVFELSDDAKTLLEQYSFPGNIRELRNITIRLSAKYSGKTVSVQNLQEELESDFDHGKIESGNEEAFIDEELKDRNFHLDDKMSQWERKYINHALAKCNGNLSKAARMLGVNRTTLYSRLQRLNIDANSD